MGVALVPPDDDDDEGDPEEPEDVADGVGKDSVTLGVTRLQNCCERLSAEESWSSHCEATQETIWLVKFPLPGETTISDVFA